MRHRVLLSVCLTLAACGGIGNRSGPDASAGSDGDTVDYDALGGTLKVVPFEGTVDIGGMLPMMALVGDKDVTGSATWIVEDQNVGKMQGSVFAANPNRGGTTAVHAIWMNLQGTATIHVRVRQIITTDCPNCPAFPEPPGKPCPAGSNPQVTYPPDGVLLPPNMNVLQVQWLAGIGTSYYEVDFKSGAVDIRVETQCKPIKDTRDQPTGGCSYDLSQAVWSLLADSSRGGEAVTVSVRATNDGTCASGSNFRKVLFAEEDIKGGLYYWQSLIVGGMAGKTGGIYRVDFADANKKAEAFLPASNTNCVGCHYLSRDGKRITVGLDDSDSDDEYADLSSRLMDVATKKYIPSQSGTLIPGGFQTFSSDHKRLFAALANAQSANFNEFNGDTGGPSIGMPSTGSVRGTQPDLSPDDKTLLFVVPSKYLPTGFSKGQENDHFIGGSLWTMPWDSMADTVGPPKELLHSTSENNFYPSWSPDKPPTFIAFNRVDTTELQQEVDQDAFHNPYAKVWLLSTKAGAQPIEAKTLNGEPKNTNSWPRWSPFVQTYHKQRLLWVTFSSTRDYGVKVRNHVKVNGQDQVNCYPPYSPQNPSNFTFPANCNQPQIWMAAINLTTAEFGTNDPSYPAFWLPFQDVTAHNHIAQWTQEVVTMGCGDGGMMGQCQQESLPCQKNGCGDCCSGLMCKDNLCQKIIM